MTLHGAHRKWREKEWFLLRNMYWGGTKGTRISRQISPMQIMIDQKQIENVEYFSYLGSLISSDARCTCAIKTKISVVKAAFKKKKTEEKKEKEKKEEKKKKREEKKTNNNNNNKLFTSKLD